MKTFFISISLMSSLLLSAQHDTILLQQVEANPVLRYNFNLGSTVQCFDSNSLSIYQSNALADLLSNETGMFIKSYGLGGLATSSVRGAGASHTKVLWNGFDVSNPMLGQVDFSYFNVNQFNDISIQMGNTSGLYGGGTQGGVVHLNNRLELQNKDELNLYGNFGSFGQWQNGVKFKTSSDKMASTFIVSHNQALNNFPYLVSGRTVRRENAEVESYSSQLSNKFSLSPYATISFHHWFQHNERGIPSIKSVPNKSESIENFFIRNSVVFTRYGKKIDLKARGAYFKEELNYYNPTSNTVSYSNFNKSIFELESNYNSKFGDLLLGVNSTYDQAQSINYKSSPTRLNNAVFTGFKSDLISDKLIVSQTIRKEFVSGRKVPLTGAFGFDYVFHKNISLKGSVSKNYKIPTFNDLYFGVEVNDQLLSESGFGGEFSAVFQRKKSNLKLTGFYNDYVNWISWQPQSNGYWQPQNNDVITRGAELSSSLNWQFGYINNTFSYVQSLEKEGLKQMIYVPKIKTASTIGFRFYKMVIGTTIQYTGMRFITSDNKISLPGFVLGNLFYEQKLPIDEAILSVSAKINNILNTSYEAIINQPMPGRYYEIGLNIKFKNNKT